MQLVWVFSEVRHRIDGLEKSRAHHRVLALVRHRIDGLEKTEIVLRLLDEVRHRIDGLESLVCIRPKTR